MRPVSAPTILLKACTTGLGLGCWAGTGGSGGAACASAGACAALSVVAPFSGFTDAPRRSGSLGVVASALATTTWAADLLESLVGKSSLGVDRCATPAASLAAFGARLTGGNGASLACAATPEPVAEGVGIAICVGSVGNETVGTGLESRDCDAVGGEAVIGAAMAGILTDAASGFPGDASAVGCAAPITAGSKSADGGGLSSEARALRSIGRSSGLTTLTWAGCVISLSGDTPASLEVATVKSLRGGSTAVGPWAVAMKGGAFGSPDSTRLNQKMEPVTAAQARTSAEALNVQAPERRPVAKSIPFGSFEYESSDSGARAGSTSTAPVSLGLLCGTSTDECRDVISSGRIGSVSVRPGFDTVSTGGGECPGASREDFDESHQFSQQFLGVCLLADGGAQPAPNFIKIVFCHSYPRNAHFVTLRTWIAFGRAPCPPYRTTIP